MSKKGWQWRLLFITIIMILFIKLLYHILPSIILNLLFILILIPQIVPFVLYGDNKTKGETK